MESKNHVDYTEKIRTFQAIVDNYNEEIALNYLTKANWDETIAAQEFFADTTSTYRNGSDRHYKEEINLRGGNNQQTYRGNSNSYQHLGQNDNDNDINTNLISPQRTTPNQPGFFSRWVIRPIVYIGSYFCSRRDNINEEEIKLNSMFPENVETVNNINSLTSKIKSKIGILVLYKTADHEYLTNLMKELKKQTYLIDILQVNYIVYPVTVSSTEGKRIISLLSDQMLYPAILFAFNKRENNTFNRGSIIDRLEGRIEIDQFRDAIIKNIETKEKIENVKDVSNVSLIQQQKEEMELLERMENERKLIEKKEKIKIEKEKEEKKRKEEELEKMKKDKSNSLPAEPESNNPNSTHIIFRYPDGNRRQERRFLRTDKIKVLYDYVDSLGTEVFDESDKYELIQPFPFKLYNKLEKTLEDEQLFPNAVLQIREI